MRHFAVALLLVTLAPLARAEAPKVLTIGMSQEPDTLHPVVSTMSVSQSIRNMVLLPVAAVNEAWQWECWLCTKIPTIENGGAKVIEEGGKKKILVTWEIRPDANWGDGQPVVGADLKLAWQIGIASTVTKGSPEAFDGIEDVILDPKNPKLATLKFKEVRYDYNQIDATFAPVPSHLEGALFAKTKDQASAYEHQTAFIAQPANPGLYNGPYRVKEINPSSHVLLERNPKYFGKPAAFPQILFKILPNTQALEANLLAGTIDMTGSVGITFDQGLAFKKRMQKDPTLARKFRVDTLEDLIFEHLDFKLRDPIIADLAVRKALMHAVDRQKLCQALFDGLQKPAAHAYHPLSPYFAQRGEDYPFDVAKAEALLDGAGWKKGANGLRVKNGQPLNLSIMSTAQNKVRELVEVHLQESWRKVGVELSIKNVPARVFFGETLRRAEFGSMGMYATTLNSPDDIQLAAFHSAKIPAAANNYAGSNYMAWKNSQVDALLDRAQVELDPAKRIALIHEGIEHYVAELPQLPLYYRASVLIAPKALKANQLAGVTYPTSLRVERWTWDEVTSH
jgi:peptide/nickel transport system substrate-binding protein